MKRIFAFLFALLIAAPALAQTQVYQSGTVTNGHPAGWVSNRFIGDIESLGGFSQFTMTASTPTFCMNSAATSGAYNQLCFGALNSAGTAGTMLYSANGGASSLPFIFSVNGGNMSVTGSALTLGTTSSLGSLALAGSTSGTITIQPQAAAGTFNFNLPTSAGTSGGPLLSGGGGSTAMSWGTISGNTTKFVTMSGSSSANECAQFDASGNIITTGSSCASSGVNAGTAGNLAYYATTGSAVSGNANLNISTAELTVGVAGSSQGAVKITGATSGTVTVGVQSAAGTYNFNLPTTAGTSGQVLTSAGGAGSPMTWANNGLDSISGQNSNFNAAANGNYCVDTSGGTITMTLPAAPANNTQIRFVDCVSTFSTNAMTVARNGSTIMGLAENMAVSTVNASATLIYYSANSDWRMQ